MSTPLDDALTPSLLLEETAAASIDTPSAGDQRTFIEITTHHWSRKNSSGTVIDLETIGQVLAADPGSPVNGTFWVTDDGGSPAAIKLRFRKGDVSYTLAEVTV